MACLQIGYAKMWNCEVGVMIEIKIENISHKYPYSNQSDGNDENVCTRTLRFVHSQESLSLLLAVLEMMQPRNEAWEGTFIIIKSPLDYNDYQWGVLQ